MNGNLVIESHGVQHTLDIGRRLGEALAGGECLALIGALGAGKTQLVKGIAAGVGVADPRTVNSPTFVLVNEYEGQPRLFHLDAFRLQSAGELSALGFEEMLTSGGTVVIEWADRVAEALPPDRLEISFEITGEQTRRLTLTPTGHNSTQLVKRASL